MDDLNHIADTIIDNFKKLHNKYDPELTVTAGAVHQTFDSLFSDFVDTDIVCDKGLLPVIDLGFGAYSNWIEAYILAYAGLLASAKTAIRRSIEFTCYSMKIGTSERRAFTWLKQARDPKIRKKFASSFSIPLCYEPEKYKVLWELIVWYDIFSIYGAHGNFESIAHSMRIEEKGDNIEFFAELNATNEESHQDALIITGLGYRMLLVYGEILDVCIEKKLEFQEIMNFIFDNLKKARLRYAEFINKGNIPPKLFNIICTDDTEFFTNEFHELVRKEKLRRNIE
jgi:hypothetical protein